MSEVKRLQHIAAMYRRTALTARVRGSEASYRVFMAASHDARRAARETLQAVAS